jgi:hypothetical protein
MSKPKPSEVPAYYVPFIEQVEEDNLIDALNSSLLKFNETIKGISEEQSNHRYADDKWSIKEVVQHITDSERIFNYRALCISRGEMQALPGYDENEYARNSNCSNKEWSNIVNEFLSLRMSSVDLYKSFDKSSLAKLGNANGLVISVNAIGFITVGHCMHHLGILQKRYL